MYVVLILIYAIFFCLPFISYCLLIGVNGLTPEFKSWVVAYKSQLLWTGFGIQFCPFLIIELFQLIE